MNTNTLSGDLNLSLLLRIEGEQTDVLETLERFPYNRNSGWDLTPLSPSLLAAWCRCVWLARGTIAARKVRHSQMNHGKRRFRTRNPITEL
jgi:hypothetical protein